MEVMASESKEPKIQTNGSQIKHVRSKIPVYEAKHLAKTLVKTEYRR